MIKRLFPPHPCTYTGQPLAKWVLIPITIMTIARSLVHILAPDGGAQSIATIPLDSYSLPGASTVITLFALWGLSQLLIGLIYAVVLWRYPGLLPLMYALMLIEYGGRILIGVFKPIELAGTAPGAVGDYVIVPLAVVMLALSLKPQKN